MKDEKEAIAVLLQNDTVLTNMLAANSRWDLPDGTKLKKWSIIPMDKYSDQAKPFIGISSSAMNRIGYEYTEAFFLIRCYNTSDKSSVEIDQILSRVKVLLHRHRFTLPERVNIETLWETTGDELTDQAYNLRFRESRFVMQLV